MRHINWDQIQAQQPQDGVSTRRFDSDGMTIVHYRFQPGARFPIHSHAEEQVVVVLSGSGHFRAGAETLRLGPGDLCHVEPHLPHGAEAGPQGLEFLNVISPRRPDV